MAWYCPRCGQAADAAAGSCARDGAALTQDNPFALVGQTLGEYTITARLGGGGFGQMYRGRHERSGLDVAIKVLSLGYDSDDVERVTKEGRALAAIRHPNVAQVHDVGMTPDRHPYVVMEYIDGQTLAERWPGRVDADEVVAIARQILRGLIAAHANGVVHRDLKPTNVLVVGRASAAVSFVRTERVVIVDFGLAKLVPPPGPYVMIEPITSRIGTPRYMAPEQIRGMPIDGRADIYSLGVMMYEALTGMPLFDGATDIAVLEARMHATRPELPPDVPKHIAAAVQRALEDDPADRFEDASEMRDALSPLRARARARWPLVIAAAAALILGVVGIAVAARSCASDAESQRSPQAVRDHAAAGTPAPGFKAPPPAPGDPPLRPDQEQMLARFAANISQGIYDTPNLTFLLCNSELGLSQLRHATDPAVAALMRRMVQMFRAAPGMANVTCPGRPVPVPSPPPAVP